MRAWEFLVEVQRVSKMTLRHINKMKKDQRAREASFARRDALLPIMYAKSGKEMERIELEKSYIELAQQQAELVNTRSEANRESNDAIKKMVAAEIKMRKVNQDKINDRAMNGLGRRKKTL